jgi:hypothetical protein
LERVALPTKEVVAVETVTLTAGSTVLALTLIFLEERGMGKGVELKRGEKGEEKVEKREHTNRPWTKQAAGDRPLARWTRTWEYPT